MVKTKTCAIWGILETNLKKCSTLKFMMNITILHSQIHHLNFHRKKVCLLISFPRKRFFSAVFDFHFRENPRFRYESQALVKHTDTRPTSSCQASGRVATRMPIRKSLIWQDHALKRSLPHFKWTPYPLLHQYSESNQKLHCCFITRTNKVSASKNRQWNTKLHPTSTSSPCLYVTE